MKKKISVFLLGLCSVMAVSVYAANNEPASGQNTPCVEQVQCAPVACNPCDTTICNVPCNVAAPCAVPAAVCNTAVCDTTANVPCTAPEGVPCATQVANQSNQQAAVCNPAPCNAGGC